MVRDPAKHSPHSPEALFSATEAPAPSSPLFWTRLIVQRPLLILGSLWLVMVCLASVAGHRLLFAEAVKDSEVAQPRSEIAVSGELNDETNDSPDTEAAPARPGARVTLWGMASLVGVCALGSVLISQHAKAAPRRQPKAKRHVRRVKPKAKAPTGPKRLQPYSPDRDAVIVKGAQAVRETLPLTMVEPEAEPVVAWVDESMAGFEAAVPPAPVSPPLPPTSREARNPAPAPQVFTPPVAQADDNITPQAEVVPQDEPHPLDWSEDSLAHALDLRQRRSLSSLM